MPRKPSKKPVEQKWCLEADRMVEEMVQKLHARYGTDHRWYQLALRQTLRSMKRIKDNERPSRASAKRSGGSTSRRCDAYDDNWMQQIELAAGFPAYASTEASPDRTSQQESKDEEYLNKDSRAPASETRHLTTVSDDNTRHCTPPQCTATNNTEQPAPSGELMGKYAVTVTRPVTYPLYTRDSSLASPINLEPARNLPTTRARGNWRTVSTASQRKTSGTSTAASQRKASTNSTATNQRQTSSTSTTAMAPQVKMEAPSRNSLHVMEPNASDMAMSFRYDSAMSLQLPLGGNNEYGSTSHRAMQRFSPYPRPASALLRPRMEIDPLLQNVSLYIPPNNEGERAYTLPSLAFFPPKLQKDVVLFAQTCNDVHAEDPSRRVDWHEMSPSYEQACVACHVRSAGAGQEACFREDCKLAEDRLGRSEGMGDPVACGYCVEKGWPCMKVEEDGDGKMSLWVVPLPASKREDKSPCDAGFWLVE